MLGGGRKLGKVVEDRRLRNRHGVFLDRAEAGRYLAGMLKPAVGGEGAVLAIPAGGVPVGVEVALALGLDFGLAVVRKVLIPWNREAGYGAVAWDGTVLINEKLRWMLGLPEEVVEEGVEEARRCVRERVERFLKILPQPRVEEREAILVDDGLASGYTMLAAVKALRKQRPRRVVVAVPTASGDAVELLEPHVDLLVVANLRYEPIYAVADAYKRWRDLDEEEVAEILRDYLRRAKAEQRV